MEKVTDSSFRAALARLRVYAQKRIAAQVPEVTADKLDMIRNKCGQTGLDPHQTIFRYPDILNYWKATNRLLENLKRISERV